MYQTSLFSLSIDAHGLKIQGTGSLKFLPKSLGGGGFREKLPGGVPLPISGFIYFYCIFINKCFEICLRGVLYLPLPLTPPPPCASMSLRKAYFSFVSVRYHGARALLPFSSESLADQDGQVSSHRLPSRVPGYKGIKPSMNKVSIKVLFLNYLIFL
jgi:hypothetical protein